MNNTEDYLIRKGKLNNQIVFDIEQKNLLYTNMVTHEGMQCNATESKNPAIYNEILYRFLSN